MWLDDLKPGQGWSGIWFGLGHCDACGALHHNEPCPVGGKRSEVEWHTFRDESGLEIRVPPARQGAIAFSTHMLLGMMQREWERPLSADHWLDTQRDAPPRRATLVLLFWVLFEGLLDRFYDAALTICPDGVHADMMKRYGHVGARMNQLHLALYKVTFLADLTQQGDGLLAEHIAKIHRCRNAFVHGDPKAISEDLVMRTIELLHDMQAAYVKLYNRRCTHLPRIIPIWDERKRSLMLQANFRMLVSILEISPRFLRRLRHSRPCHIDSFGVLQRHPRRFPSPRLRDRGQVDIEGHQVLSGSNTRRVFAHLLQISFRHPNPLGHPFEYRRDTPWV
jgi:hypothetical protein